uniref:ANK_REP_REGION domain-containing protein n=1 Tax=Macrostomum lignano TaxID=282301 RepID=A0A1I8FUL9_9PLAT
MQKRRLAGKELFKSLVTQVMVARNSHSLFNLTTLKNIKEFHSTMNEFDQYGWAPIHRAAERGLLASVERFAVANPGQLELTTRDRDRLTPLLVAADRGQTD